MRIGVIADTQSKMRPETLEVSGLILDAGDRTSVLLRRRVWSVT